MQLKLNTEKTAAIGLVGIIIFSICWICAVILDGTWVFGENMVSDLGVSDTDAKYFFNYGCIAAGIIIYVYGILTAYFNKLTLDRVCYVLIAIAGMFLIGVGTFTEDLGWPHNLCAYSLFIAVFISAILRIILDFINRDRVFAIVTAVLINIYDHCCCYTDVSVSGSICNHYHSDLDYISMSKNNNQN